MGIFFNMFQYIQHYKGFLKTTLCKEIRSLSFVYNFL